jgi:uncharacterized lipoprotein YbaY
MKKIFGKITAKSLGKKLEAESVTHVTIKQCSDVESKILAEILLEDLGEFPISYEIEFDENIIQKSSSSLMYTLSAWIVTDDEINYVNDSYFPIVNKENGLILEEVDICLAPVGKFK